ISTSAIIIGLLSTLPIARLWLEPSCRWREFCLRPVRRAAEQPTSRLSSAVALRKLRSSHCERIIRVLPGKRNIFPRSSSHPIAQMRGNRTDLESGSHFIYVTQQTVHNCPLLRPVIHLGSASAEARS